MENKYYELIVDTIKSHRKFEGLEDILDDIVDDVCEHVKHAISTIADEDVISSYIQKVVSTSIITVPKKLGVKNRTSKKSITDILPPPRPMEIVEEGLGIVEEEYICDDTVDDEAVYEEIIETEDIGSDGAIDVYDELAEEISDENAEMFVEDSIDSEFVSNDEVLVETEIETEDFQVSEDIHKGFVDKMINGVAEEVISNDVNSDLEYNSSEPAEDDFFEDLLVADEVDFVEIEDEVVEDVIVEPSNFAQELEDVEEFSIVEEDKPEVLVPDFVKPTYACFSYEPKVDLDIDINDLYSDIDDLDKKYPELNIRTVWDLKYKQKMSIEQIVDELNVTKECVIDALSELADVIRG